MIHKNSLYITIVLIVGIIITANVLAQEYFLRLDLTQDKRYTLSEATENILDDLQVPVTVTAYFSEDLPPDIAKTREDFQDMLIEYASLADGMLVYEFINPNEDEEAEQQAAQNGVQPVLVNVREKDQMKQQRAFLGAVVQMSDNKEVIPFIQPGAAMEYALSTSIKKLSVTEKPYIGLLQGHGEPTLAQLPQISNSLGILYNFENLTLTDTTAIPARYKTVAIVAPTDSFPQTHLDHLDAFLAQGGSLFIAMNRVDGNLQNAMGSPIHTGLESWLQNKGIQVENSFVTDANCGAVTVQQQQGFFTFNSNVSFPFLPIISSFAEHPITQGLEAVILPFASPLTYTGNDTTGAISYTPIAQTSENSGSVNAPTYFDISREWTESDFPLANLTVGATLEGNIVGDTPAKMVVFGDGDFPSSGGGQGGQSDNASLMVNSIDWLSDDTGLIELRTKGVTSRPIKQLEEATKTSLKYLNFLLPILLVIIYGVFRMQVKRNIRAKRMEETYV